MYQTFLLKDAVSCTYKFLLVLGIESRVSHMYTSWDREESSLGHSREREAEA